MAKIPHFESIDLYVDRIRTYIVYKRTIGSDSAYFHLGFVFDEKEVTLLSCLKKSVMSMSCALVLGLRPITANDATTGFALELATATEILSSVPASCRLKKERKRSVFSPFCSK